MIETTPSPGAVRLQWPQDNASDDPSEGTLRIVRLGTSNCRLIRGDNLPVLRALAEPVGTAHLCYLDPPFFTGRPFLKVSRGVPDVEGRRSRAVSMAFDDRWPDLGSYLGALRSRVAAARRLLAPEGCLVVHVDPRTSHYVKVMCDEIFGRAAFASEIVWRYRRWPAKTPNFQRVHDVLLRYVRDPSVQPRFVQLYEPLAASTRATWGTGKQRAIVEADGRRSRSSVGEEASPGVPMGDVWDIGIVAPVARERTGYPTQKPEALLERLIRACTLPGDLVVDPYMGSGTTLAVAARLDRRTIGVDESDAAHATARTRLTAQGVQPREEKLALSERPPLGA